MSSRLMPSPLVGLKSKLSQSLSNAIDGRVWGAPQEMSRALADVKTSFDNANATPNERSIGKALLAFRNTGDLPTFIDLKYACYGLSQTFGREGWSLIGDPELFPAFLRRVDKESPKPRRFRKCYQGLMHSYFSYDIFDAPSEAAKLNWRHLQKYLRERMHVALSATNMPAWLKSFSEHQNLVSDKPCERYASALLKGDSSELASAGEGIGISNSSWLWQEAMVAHTQAVTKQSDDGEFKKLLEPLIDLLDGKGDIELSETVVVECAAQLLIRYTKCIERAEHSRLRDLAVNHIGNPWLKRNAWDAFVRNEDARKMVDGWLKRRLITDFFELLSEDGSADERRLNYWLRFEPVIEDMWFALGPHARSNSSLEFREMRKRMEGRFFHLDGTGNKSDNNAFIMRIGHFLVVEFGVIGNACYIYNAADLPLDEGRRDLSIHQLKVKSKATGWLIHMNEWEQKFDEWICPRINWKPAGASYVVSSSSQRRTTPRRSPANRLQPLQNDEYRKFVNSYRLTYQDKRTIGGAFWVYTDQDDPVVTRKLKEMGFKYAPNKGWWKE